MKSMRRLTAALLVFPFLLNCSSLPSKKELSEEKRKAEEHERHPIRPFVSCAGRDGGCAVVGGVMLIIAAAGGKYSPAERKANLGRLGGHCEIRIEEQGKAPDAKPVKKPCEQVLLTITNADGVERKAWIDGYDFDVFSLSKPPFHIVAESEGVSARSEVKNVKLGTDLRILLTVTVKKGAAQ